MTRHNFESAKQIAEGLARSEIQFAELPGSHDVLCNECMEAEGCWVFFLSDRLKVQMQPGQLTFTAYAVPKNGGMPALVYDFRPNLEQMQSYVELWSLYALGKKAEANTALELLKKKFPSDGAGPNQAVHRTLRDRAAQLR